MKNGLRSYADFTYLTTGDNYIYAGLDPFGYSLLFNPETIRFGRHLSHNGMYNDYYEYDLRLGGGFVVGDTIPVSQNEGSFSVATKAWGTNATGNKVVDSGGLFYQILKTSSEIVITGEDGTAVRNDEGQIPHNPTEITVGRSITDNYGDASYYWEIVGPNDFYLEGNQNTLLPNTEELQALEAGTYTVTNTVKETVPFGSKFYKKLGTDGQELTATDTSTSSFVIAKVGDVVVNHWLAGETAPRSEHLTGTVGSSYKTVPLSELPEGYSLDESKYPTNWAGNYKEEETIVDYFYKKIATTITAHYIDEETAQAIPGVPEVSVTAEYGDLYKTEKKDIKGYDFIKLDPLGGSPEGQHGLENLDINYLYRKKESNLILQHYDLRGQTINSPEASELQIPGKYGQAYDVTPL